MPAGLPEVAYEMIHGRFTDEQRKGIVQARGGRRPGRLGPGQIARLHGPRPVRLSAAAIWCRPPGRAGDLTLPWGESRRIEAVPEPGLLLIGPFSRASCLSVKTLRRLPRGRPARSGGRRSRTGYRSYSIAQLTDAAVIRRLRALDVPLEAIGQILEARDPETTRKVLREHAIVLEERLAATQRAVDVLYAALDVPASHTPVHVRHEPARSTLTLSESGADAEPFLRRAAAVLEDAVNRSGAVAERRLRCAVPDRDRGRRGRGRRRVRPRRRRATARRGGARRRGPGRRAAGNRRRGRRAPRLVRVDGRHLPQPRCLGGDQRGARRPAGPGVLPRRRQHRDLLARRLTQELSDGHDPQGDRARRKS